jgi:hypothetical protein
MDKKIIANPTIRAWFEMAMQHGRRNDSFLEVVKSSEQHRAWIAYFNHLGWAPITFRRFTKSWTAPCGWPDSLPAFESHYCEPYRPQWEAWEALPRLSAAELDAQFARLGLSHLRPGSKFVPNV